MSLAIRLLTNSGDGELLTRVAAGVFDHGINAMRCREFLSNPRHHLAVATDSRVVAGMASGVHDVHPDKEPELWVNEVGIAPTHRNRGLGKQLLHALLNVGRQLGYTEAWVVAERSNARAMRLYTSCGGSEGARDQVMFTFKLC